MSLEIQDIRRLSFGYVVNGTANVHYYTDDAGEIVSTDLIAVDGSFDASNGIAEALRMTECLGKPVKYEGALSQKLARELLTQMGV